jgi:hypothetical protein
MGGSQSKKKLLHEHLNPHFERVDINKIDDVRVSYKNRHFQKPSASHKKSKKFGANFCCFGMTFSAIPG